MSRHFGTISKILFIIICLSITLGTDPAWARASRHKVHHKIAVVDGSASYADLVIDGETGQILHATNPDSLRHPASLTKMMTLYLTFQALEAGKLSLNQYLPVSSNAAEQSPSKLGLRPGARIRVEDLILGIVTLSANDGAVVIGEWLGGSEHGFAQMMTKQAHALGMSRTNFDNPSGLPDDAQVTTARDMAILGHSLIYHFSQFYPYFSHDSFTYDGIPHHNHNHLMDRYDGMDGIKTGYIRASGFNLVASAKRGSTRLIGVVFGGKSATARDNRMAQLLDECFANASRLRGTPKVAQREAEEEQGDSADTAASDGSHYVTLPAKIAAIFPSRGASASRDVDAETAPSAGASWGIQIGAYSDEEVGRQALASVAATLPSLLASAQPQVQPVSGSDGVVVYRARLVALDQRTAQSACNWLIHHQQNCLTVEQ